MLPRAIRRKPRALAGEAVHVDPTAATDLELRDLFTEAVRRRIETVDPQGHDRAGQDLLDLGAELQRRGLRFV